MAYLISVVICMILSTAVLGRETLKLQHKDYMKYSKSVMAGAKMGLQECQKLFRYEPWNCFVPKNVHLMPIVNRARLPEANKEAAFIHAITSAGVMYSVIVNCSLGHLENCRCQPKSRQKVRSKSGESVTGWHWGGCSDNVAFGDLVTRHFVDALEGKRGDLNEERRTLNLHNNKVGRKVVKLATKKVCKCHGSSSSCTMKTCMKKLQSFDKVGEALWQKYHKAKRVQFNNGSLINEANEQETKKTQLAYYKPSPNYCHANEELKFPGVVNRVCEADDGAGLENCKKLCKDCGLQMKYKMVIRKQKCNCKFVWCCFVKCEECERKVITATCSR